MFAQSIWNIYTILNRKKVRKAQTKLQCTKWIVADICADGWRESEEKIGESQKWIVNELIWNHTLLVHAYFCFFSHAMRHNERWKETECVKFHSRNGCSWKIYRNIREKIRFALKLTRIYTPQTHSTITVTMRPRKRQPQSFDLNMKWEDKASFPFFFLEGIYVCFCEHINQFSS